MEFIKVISRDRSPFRMQECSNLPSKIQPYLQNIYDKSSEEYISVNLTPPSNTGGVTLLSRLLVRISAFTTSTEIPYLVSDMRVRELYLMDKFSELNLEEADVLIACGIKDMSNDFLEWQKMVYVKMQQSETSLSQEQNPPVRVLKCGVIRRLTVTLVFDDLCHYRPFQSNTYYTELIRDYLKLYCIYVKANTIIDTRKCPFLSGISPNILFIFVHTCKMSSLDVEVGKLSKKSEIQVTRYHDMAYYFRIFNTLSTDTSECVAGLEGPFEILNSAFKTRVKLGLLKFSKKLNYSKCFYSGLLLAGTQGSGKKLLVREIARRFSAKLLTLNLAAEENDIRQDPVKISQKLTEMFNEAERFTSYYRYPIVVVLENLDVLHTKNEGFVSRSLRNKTRVLNHLCCLLDLAGAGAKTNSPLLVVGTTSKPYLIPDKLRVYGRLQHEVFIKVPDSSQRSRILQTLLKENSELSSLNFDSIAKRTPGYVAADLIRLMHLAILKSREVKDPQVTEGHLKYALSRVLPTVLQGTIGVVGVQPEDTFDHISGLDQVKLDLIKTIVWPLTAPNVFKRLGLSPPKGIILYGPSGCGKTTLVRAASSHRTNFLSVSAAELFCSGVGDSEKIIAHLFHRARLASPCVLFIDELDAIAGSRCFNSSSGGKSVNETILAMLLTEMDGVGARTAIGPSNLHQQNEDFSSFGERVVVVGATNRPEMIDPALLRPGRFDKLVPVPPPTETDRLKLLQNCTKNTPLNEDVCLEELAARTERYSGADIINLCREGALFALSEDMNIPSVFMKHYERALAQLAPSISQEYLDSFYEYASSGSTTSTQDLTKRMKSLHIKSSK